MSPSLDIIIQELEEEGLSSFWDMIGDRLELEHWAKQGVLLLNAALTVVEGQPGSHRDAWEPFIRELLKMLKGQGIVFVLLGSVAQYYERFIPDEVVIKAPHPAADTYRDERKFRGSGVFNRINENLKTPVKW